MEVLENYCTAYLQVKTQRYIKPGFSVDYSDKGPIVYYFPGGEGGAVVLEGGYNFKTSPCLGGKFFSGKKHEGGQIL